jgi:pimeloyl-ACP methyl ester carboxylesterase
MTTNLLPTQTAGSPADPAIIFLHGGPLSSRMWAPQLAGLADEFYCLAPDLPGHGQSSGLPFTMHEAALRVADLIHARVVGAKATVVGLSLGGAVALELLRCAPELVERVMVSGTAARLERLTGKLSLAMLGLMSGISAEKQAAMTMKQLCVPEGARELVWDDFMRGATPAYTRQMIEALMTMELPETIDCPLLVTVGGKETLPARQAARKLLKCYPQARAQVAPGLHHLWNLENPDLFNQTVREFVKSGGRG